MGIDFDDRFNGVIKYIHQNINKNITVDELAKLYCVEKNYFIRVFKAKMSVPPYRYIKEYRLKLALTYLERGISVSEIAELVGYFDTAAFSHAFKKKYGIAANNLKSKKMKCEKP